jgi:hypothetical protein
MGMSYFTPLPFAPGSYEPVTGNNSLTFIGTGSTPYTFQWGQVQGVAGDASAAAVVAFPEVFPNALVSLQLSIGTPGTSPSGFSLTPEAYGPPNTAGFSVSVSGGNTGSTCTVYYVAIGY